MQRSDINDNYFAILEIAPTLDYQLIRNAYKEALKKHHTDKAGEASKAKTQAIIQAWNALKEQAGREQCHKKYGPGGSGLNNNDPAQPAQVIVRPPRELSPDEVTNAVVDSSEKIVVFIPVQVTKHFEVNDFSQPGILSHNDVAKSKDINFDDIARKINDQTSQYLLQVGVDLEETRQIIQLHSYYRRFRGCYGAEVIVNFSDLNEMRKSEAELFPGMLNAKSNSEFFTLKPGTKISPEQIVSIQLSFDDFASERGVPQLEDKKIVNRGNLLGYRESEQPIAALTGKIATPFELCIHDKIFWKNITHGLSDFPNGIKSMQKSVTQDGLYLEKLRTIAIERLQPRGFLGSLLGKQEPLTTEFYGIVRDAANIDDLQQKVAAFHKRGNVLAIEHISSP